MKPAQQIPLQETCQKLQEVGIEFDSHFVWYKFAAWHVRTKGSLPFPDVDFVSGPTVPELLEKMPKTLYEEGMNTTFHFPLRIIPYEDGKCRCYYQKHNSPEQVHENLAEALAQMLLWLHDNNHLEKK